MKLIQFVLLLFVIALSVSQTDGQWVQTDVGGNRRITSLFVSGTNVCAGSADGGVFLSTNSGTNWKYAGLPTSYLTAVAIVGTNLFASTGYDYATFFSTDNGTSWTAHPSCPGRVNVFYAVNCTTLYAGNSMGVFRSTNGGTSWTKASTGLTETYVEAFAFSGTNLFAGTGDGVFLSTNSGTSWTPVKYDFVNCLAVSGTNLYAGTKNGGLYLSTNNGTSWVSVESNLTSTWISSLAVSGTNVFAAVSPGVFLSTNNGTNWTWPSNGLKNTDVRELAVSGTNLIAGTWGGGVWRRPLAEMITSVEPVTRKQSEEFTLSQNYPNHLIQQP